MQTEFMICTTIILFIAGLLLIAAALVHNVLPEHGIYSQNEWDELMREEHEAMG